MHWTIEMVSVTPTACQEPGERGKEAMLCVLITTRSPPSSNPTVACHALPAPRPTWRFPCPRHTWRFPRPRPTWRFPRPAPPHLEVLVEDVAQVPRAGERYLDVRHLHRAGEGRAAHRDVLRGECGQAVRGICAFKCCYTAPSPTHLGVFPVQLHQPSLGARGCRFSTRSPSYLVGAGVRQAAYARPVARPKGAVLDEHVRGMHGDLVVADGNGAVVHPRVIAVDVNAVLR